LKQFLLLPASLLIIVLFPASAFTEDSCKNANTTLQMRLCARQQFEEADTNLNRSYRRLMQKLDAPGKTKLVTAEKAWLAYRDTHCAFDADSFRGGSIQPQVEASCRTELTRQRVNQLDQQFKRKR
jgi:uncharacterized protein YecT (DUF1311 family)